MIESVTVILYTPQTLNRLDNSRRFIMNKLSAIFQKIATYSNYTLQKLSKLATTQKRFNELVDIIEKSDTEEEVLEQLNVKFA